MIEILFYDMECNKSVNTGGTELKVSQEHLKRSPDGKVWSGKLNMNAHLTINTGPLRKEFNPCAAINKYAQETFPGVSE